MTSIYIKTTYFAGWTSTKKKAPKASNKADDYDDDRMMNMIFAMKDKLNEGKYTDTIYGIKFGHQNSITAMEYLRMDGSIDENDVVMKFGEYHVTKANILAIGANLWDF